MDSTGVLADDDLVCSGSRSIYMRVAALQVAEAFMRHVAPLAYNADVSSPGAISNLTRLILDRNYKVLAALVHNSVS